RSEIRQTRLRYAMDTRRIRTHAEQLANGFTADGINEFRCDFAQWHENKSPHMEHGVGYGEMRLPNDFVFVKYDVDIEGPRTLGRFPYTTILLFDVKACTQ